MELAAWLRLTLVPGVGGEARRALLKAFGLPEAIFSAGPGELSRVVDAPTAERLRHHDCAAAIDAAWSGRHSPATAC
jgi:DNA processing protein